MADDLEVSLEDVLTALQKYVATFPTRGDAAKALKVSRTFLWKVVEGQANPPDSFLKQLGFKRERLITYKYYKAKEDA